MWVVWFEFGCFCLGAVLTSYTRVVSSFMECVKIAFKFCRVKPCMKMEGIEYCVSVTVHDYFFSLLT